MNETAPEQREATSLKMLGAFFVILGALVLLATFWTLDNFRASVVNVGSGSILVAVGAGMLLFARRLDRRAAQADESATD